MTVTTAPPETDLVEPPREHVPASGHAFARWWSDTLVFAGRNIEHIRQIPEKLLDVTLQPLMFVLLFAYVFGGAIAIDGGNYKEFLIGGILIQSLAFGLIGPATSISTDLTEGVIDRFRSLPATRTAYLSGHYLAELIGMGVSIAVLLGAGLVVGWGVHSSPPEVLGAFLLLFAFASAMVWIGTWIGLTVRSPDAVMGVGFVVVFPLTFLSNAFVPIESLPNVLQWVAAWNPVSVVVAAVRELFGNPVSDVTKHTWPLDHPVPAAFLYCAVLLAIAIPATLRRYRAHQRLTWHPVGSGRRPIERTCPTSPTSPTSTSAPSGSRTVTAMLHEIAADPAALEVLTEKERIDLLNAAGDVFAPDVELRRQRVRARQRRERAEKIRRDQDVLAETGIRRLRAKPVFTTPNVFPPEGFVADDVIAGADDARDVTDPQHCYVCKQKYVRVHHFYDQLCPTCGELNFAKRTESADLRGRVALLTGGRVKIGYQAGIKLLRAGASVIVTTRFPRDSALRSAREPDFEDWGDRLEIFGLDLRHTPSVEAFCHHILETRSRLDFIVNNACQTVRRPPDFYRHMMELETASLATMPERARALLGEYEGLRGYDLVGESTPAQVEARPNPIVGLTHAAELSQAPLLPDDARPQAHLFPAGELDQDLQQVDLRGRNSWRLTLAEVSSVELLETQLVNAVAPFVLNGRLKPLMLRTPDRDKHIVNVSAVEGQFYRRFKTTKHPHTNMAKAALNMMTRTSATEYHADGIHMNSVDTGWVSDEDPVQIAAQKTAEHGFHPPLDIVDGAARIVDPIIAGFNSGTHVYGQFLKDYRSTDW